MTRRLYTPALPDEGGEVRLDPGSARHTRVLRLSVGDAIVLFDGRGAEAEGRIAHLAGAEVRCVVGPPRARARPGPAIVLCQCVPKGGKLEDIVRASTELGVSAIHLVASERSVPRLDDDRAERRLTRLTRVAQEAARQSGRSDVPDVLAPAPPAEVLARAPADAVRVVFAPGAASTLEQAIAAPAPLGWLLVGPEGGLSPVEIDLARGLGFTPVGLGPTVLRVETAAPVAVALLTHALGGLRPR